MRLGRTTLAAFFLQLPCAAVQADVISVNSSADLFPADPSHCLAGNPATCTLRDAIARTVDGDVVDFATDLTISIVSGHTINLTKNIVITGVGHAITIDGANAVTPFTIASMATARIEHLTIRNGNGDNTGGGAIYNAGTLTLTDSTLTDGTAAYGGGILNKGTLTIARCTITGSHAGGGGGAIANLYGSTATVSSSTLSGNTGFWGGAINNADDATVTLVNSTVANNRATAGGAIRNWLGNVTMINSTLANPTSGISGSGNGGDIAT